MSYADQTGPQVPEIKFRVDTNRYRKTEREDPKYAGLLEVIEQIKALPTVKVEDSYLSKPDVATRQKRLIWESTGLRLLNMASDCGEQTRFFALSWASDCYVALGDLAKALGVLPLPAPSARNSVAVSQRLSLKQALAYEIDAAEILSLFGPRLTKFGKENMGAVEKYIQIALDEIYCKQNKHSLLKEWCTDALKSPIGFNLFRGHPSHIMVESPDAYDFSYSAVANDFCVTLIREAENTLREDLGLPKVGEGWVSETVLFYQIKRAFEAFEVLQHASPRWLGRQHFDIFMPEISLALEYQGIQHDQPIDFFGGEAAYEQTKKRDLRKLRLAKKNGVQLIYVRPGYELLNVIEKISKVAAIYPVSRKTSILKNIR